MSDEKGSKGGETGGRRFSSWNPSPSTQRRAISESSNLFRLSPLSRHQGDPFLSFLLQKNRSYFWLSRAQQKSQKLQKQIQSQRLQKSSQSLRDSFPSPTPPFQSSPVPVPHRPNSKPRPRFPKQSLTFVDNGLVAVLGSDLYALRI